MRFLDRTTDQVGGLGDALKFLGFGNPIVGGIGGASTAADVAMIPNFEALAAGGDFFGGRPILVGEQGSEIITPRASGTVIPNDQIGGKSVNNNVRISINVPGNVTRETADQIGAGARVARALSRNG